MIENDSTGDISALPMATIVRPHLQPGEVFSTCTKNTDIPERKKLEKVIVNLATLANATVVNKLQGSRGAYFYEVQSPGFDSYQSATNTILELSRTLIKQKSKAQIG